MQKHPIESSYTAFNQFPIKAIKSTELIKLTKKGIIPPLHIIFYPTNKCNLKCPFCYLKKRNPNLEMDFSKAKKTIDLFKKLGTKAVSISGGGEPLLYPKINELINYFYSKNIKIGLITNGLLLDRLKKSTLKKLIWLRISFGDGRKIDKKLEKSLKNFAKKNNKIALGINYVATKKTDFELIGKLVKFVNKANFKYIKITVDLNILKNESQKIEAKIKEFLIKKNISQEKIIYTEISSSKGNDCFIFYLKPIITPEFNIHRCCVAEGQATKNSKYLCVGNLEEYEKMSRKRAIPFDGTKCDFCCFNNYNKLLKNLVSNIDHEDFI